MRGRKPTPTAYRKLHGNPGKRRLPAEREEPQPRIDASLPEPPDHLDEIAKAEWRRIVPELNAAGLMTVIDRAAVAAYCAQYGRWVVAEEKLKLLETRWLAKTPNGAVQQVPWLSIANRALELMHKFLVEFGMTAASRVKLGHRPPAAPNIPPPEPPGDAPQHPPPGSSVEPGGDFAAYLARGGNPN